MELLKIDAHQHFWNYNDHDYVWMQESMSILRSNHEPCHLKPLLEQVGIGGTVAVQARQMEAETHYLLDLAARNHWIKGVVGWMDFSSAGLEERVARVAEHPKLKGLRELIHDMPDVDYAMSAEHKNAIAVIGAYDLSYDLLLRPAHIPAAIRLVDTFPKQRFIVDHIAKPEIATGKLEPWRALITELSRRPNVYCKLSGMATEADWNRWSRDQLYPYIDVCVEAFGPQRLMIGSDWPVCKLAGTYQQIMSAVVDYVSKLSLSEQQRIFSATCIEAYVLE